MPTTKDSRESHHVLLLHNLTSTHFITSQAFHPCFSRKATNPSCPPPPHPLNLTWACKGPGLPHSILRIILRALFPCLFVLSFSKSTLKSHPPADNESGTLPQSLSIHNQMHKSKSHVLLSAKDASISFSSHSLTLSPQPCFSRSNPDQSIHQAINPHGKKAHHHENHESPENPKNKNPPRDEEIVNPHTPSNKTLFSQSSKLPHQRCHDIMTQEEEDDEEEERQDRPMNGKVVEREKEGCGR